MHDDRLLQLTPTQRGLYWSLYLLAGSDATETVGMFIRDDKPMSSDAIAFAIHMSNQQERATVRDTLGRLEDVGLMKHEDGVGWQLTTWEKDQSGIKADASRTAARLRKRRQRQRSNITPLSDYK